MTKTQTNININAHLALIQKLLTCPRGREWDLLREHDDLLTPEFINTMTEVIGQLEAENSLDAARFVQLWRNKLIQALASAEAQPPMRPIDQAESDRPIDQAERDRDTNYLQLIRALLDCRKGAEASVLNANRHLVDQGFVQTMQAIAVNLLEQGDQDTAEFLSRLAQNLQIQLAQPASLDAPDQPQQADEPPSAVMPIPTPVANKLQEQIEQMLASWKRFEATKTLRSQPVNPLWYMEVLERACEAEWLLSSDEVAQLIGIHPHCGSNESGFQRGSWWFEKSDMIGHQNAWRVTKRPQG
jgi:hypothetical protein